MILDVPTHEDFFESGIGFLNLAWSTAIDLVLDLDDSGMNEPGEDGEITDAYWERAQRPLSTAVALAQQGTEFLLKARVAEVSPFFLLSGSSRDWPKGCEQRDCPYSEFHTVDAQDLVRVHDTVSSNRLSQEFRQEFDKVRRVRNSVMHTVSKKQRFAADEVLKWVLHARLELAASKTWVTHRTRYLETSSPGGAIPDYDGVGWGPRVAREVRAAIDSLSPAECQLLLGIDKKRRFYYCVGCHWHKVGLDSHEKTAQLDPNTPDSTAIYCYACEAHRPVRRVDCTACAGNVQDEETDDCLSCGE